MGLGKHMKTRTFVLLNRKGESCFVKDLLNFYWTRDELRVRALCPRKARDPGRIKLETDRYDLLIGKYFNNYLEFSLIVRKSHWTICQLVLKGIWELEDIRQKTPTMKD